MFGKYNIMLYKSRIRIQINGFIYDFMTPKIKIMCNLFGRNVYICLVFGKYFDFQIIIFGYER